MFMHHLIKIVIKNYFKSHVGPFTDIKTFPHSRGRICRGKALAQNIACISKVTPVDFFSIRIQDSAHPSSETQGRVAAARKNKSGKEM